MYVYGCGYVLPSEGPCGGQRGQWFPQSWSYMVMSLGAAD